MGGDHCFLPGGNGRLVHALAENVPILYERIVNTVSYATVAGGPLLIALVAGEAAHKFETMPPTDAVTQVIQILKGNYEPQGITVPEPIQTICTRWGSDHFSLGAYSNVAVGASGDD
ncbi:hypothetical protein ACFX15_040321 [Malus domestica]